MATIVEKFFDSKDALTAELSTTLEQSLVSGIEADGRAVLMVSGGSSPAPAYKHLSNLALDWAKIDVAMVDERWVDVAHEKSNEAFIKSTLLQNHGAAANFITMKNNAETAQQGSAECEAAYQQLKRPFDVTILGMGPDGHTASLFPGAQGVAQALDPNNQCAVVAVTPLDAPHERLTLTASRLLNTRALYLQISGKDKNDLLQNILSTPGNTLPIATFLHQTQVRLDIFTTVG